MTVACAPALTVPALAQDAAQPILNSAGTALQKGLLDQAVQFYTDALAEKGLSNDRRATIHVDRGAAHMRRQNMKAAIDDFNRAVQLSPEYAPTYNNRGNALIAVGALREALKDFDRAVILAPSYGAAFANRASAHFRLGNKDQALADYSKAIEVTPQSVSALNGRGLVHLGAERPHAAVRDFTRALALDIRFAAGYRNRAAAKSVLDRNEDVIEDLSRAITFDARSLESHLLRADLYLAANNAQAALKDFNRAIELAPKSAAAFTGRGQALAKAENYDEALNDLGRAIEVDPKFSRAYAVRVWVYKQMQQLDLAQKDMERGLKLEPLTADALWAQGELEDARGRNDAAIQAFTKALGIEPRHRLTLDALNRLGLIATREETEVSGAGADGWRVLQSGEQFVAVHAQFATLRVPLEMLGPGTPKISGWERQKSPYTSYGILRFSAGKLELPGKAAETLEVAAIVDTQTQATLGLTLDKRGGKAAVWSWDDGRLNVASAEGIQEEFALRGSKAAPASSAVAAVPERASTSRREGSSGGSSSSGSGSTSGSSSGGSKQAGTPAWAPWSQNNGPSNTAPPRQQAAKQKPKGIFEMLFGN